ncbi:GntR family transcriptional regulator [Curtobacterium sp. 'Ferrero']|uniref:MocR-like pyridoxine biosynthesis transcription factor PdxR n=1 Tax=Curtobacterium sp. 'Ferrero' TaxID=2033654 RepID=UPI000BD78AAE|nr:PLP-dependent aminotransferase family protein [Curtobacterium sp. 'Ferrero']PCN48343.1 GntR family transcriptional regulator [Curtobacterium sp. 'Ferrero']
MDQYLVQMGGGRVDQSGKAAGVVTRIRALVESGALRDGDRVPSTRAMAAELGVARGTVVAAYDQLDGEGYIRTRPGTAAVVVGGRRDGASALPPPIGVGAVVSPVAESDGPDDPAALPLLDARPGIPAVTAIAPRDWRAAWRAAAAAPLRNRLSDPLGTDELRTQVAAQLGLTRGFAPPADRVVVCAGTSDALSVVTEGLRHHLGRAPRIAVEDPGYPTGRRAVRSAGGEVLGVPVTEDGIALDALAALPDVDAVVVSPTHQYPFGSVMPVARRRALLAWAQRTGTLVVEDDYDSEFRHRGTPVPALAALDTTGCVLHLGGVSKTLDPRLRCAWAVLPQPPAHSPWARATEAVATARRARGPVVAEPVQVAVAHLMRNGALRRHLGRVRRDYTHRRERIAAWVRGVDGLEARALDGGLHAVVTWSGPATGHQVVERVADAGVRLAALEDYGLGADSTGAGVVLGYGPLTLPELDRTLAAIEEAVGRL